MKMCNECYELFDDSILADECPIFKCDGDLVFIDSEIAEIISQLNIALASSHVPMRTLFTCSGHLRNIGLFPYIGFELWAEDEEDGKSLSTFISEDFLEKPLESFNQRLSEIESIEIERPYEISYSVLTRGPEEWPRYRLFVNDFYLKYLTEDRNPREKIYIQIQYLFKLFLLDVIEQIKKIGEERNARDSGNTEENESSVGSTDENN